jgi:hypothetical protein
MKRPVVGLLIQGSDALNAVARGRKTITIREGHRDYQTGDRLMLGCPWLNWMLFAEVAYVRHSLAAKVLPEDLADAGYSSHEHMVEDLRRFYPNLTLESPVTVVRWTNVQGKLVNEIALVAIYRALKMRHHLPMRARQLRAILFESDHSVFGSGVHFDSLLKSLGFNKWLEEKGAADNPYICLTKAGIDMAYGLLMRLNPTSKRGGAF